MVWASDKSRLHVLPKNDLENVILFLMDVSFVIEYLVLLLADWILPLNKNTTSR